MASCDDVLRRLLDAGGAMRRLVTVSSATFGARETFDAARLHDDEEAARRHIESIRWPNGPCCPHCGIAGTAKPLGGNAMGPGWYHCAACRRKFTVRVGTALERSHIPLRKWLHATAVISTSRRSVSVRQLRRMLGVSYRAALIMSRRIKHTMASDRAA
jgi:transposase-like protein